MRHSSGDEPSSAPPRFPVARVAACGIGLLAAGYLWLGWGYCWEVTPRDLAQGKPPLGFRSWQGTYVRARGIHRKVISSAERGIRSEGEELLMDALRQIERDITFPCFLHDRGDDECFVLVIWKHREEHPLSHDAGHSGLRRQAVSYAVGRADLAVTDPDDPIAFAVVNATRGRVNGMSLIAVVVAFWSAVFLYLWLADWWRARRRFEAIREEGRHGRGA